MSSKLTFAALVGSAYVCRYGPDVVLSGAHKPDLVVFLDPQSQLHVLREVNNMRIPSMGQSITPFPLPTPCLRLTRTPLDPFSPHAAITDTDVDPRMFTYPIYGNLDVRLASLLDLLPASPHADLSSSLFLPPRSLLPHHCFPSLSQSGRSTELILGALGRAGEEGLLARQGRASGGNFPLVKGQFQAKIDTSHSPAEIEERQPDADQWRLSTYQPERLDRERRAPGDKPMGRR